RPGGRGSGRGHRCPLLERGLQDGFGHPALAYADDVADALVLEDALHALDGEALIVEEMADALEEKHVLGPVVTPATAPLQRLDVGKTRFPEPQYVLRKVKLLGGFGDRAEGVR